jgi:VIT1/CCC1 family predicted Fe2+/Mn2+ transporter
MTTISFKAPIYAVAWLFAHTLTLLILQGFPGQRVYAALNAWWFCFYVASLLSVDVWSGFIGAVVVAAVFILSALFGLDPLYFGTSGISGPMILFTAGAAILVVVSPALLNYTITKVVGFSRRTWAGHS